MQSTLAVAEEHPQVEKSPNCKYYISWKPSRDLIQAVLEIATYRHYIIMNAIWQHMENEFDVILEAELDQDEDRMLKSLPST